MDLGADGPDIVLTASTVQGLRWACVELENLGSGLIARGYARDVPAYAVRGFGIDVARRSFSLDFLKDIVKRMSRARMNTLEVHLNDNAIRAQSNYDGTVEGQDSSPLRSAWNRISGGKDGKSITSEDESYSKEEFAELIRFGAVYGVDVVPEIDTPAHCLALTRAFPEYGRSDTPEAADELDLSRGRRKEARRIRLEGVSGREWLLCRRGSRQHGHGRIFWKCQRFCAVLHRACRHYSG